MRRTEGLLMNEIGADAQSSRRAAAHSTLFRMLRPPAIPGLLVTGTDTEIGKTVIAAAIAQWFRDAGVRVGVFKPVASGCVKRREGLVSEDAEFLAHCAGARQPLDLICPQRYAESLAPAIAAERAKEPVNWDIVQGALSVIESNNDIVIVEGVGGVRVPMDAKHTFLDVARWLDLPAVVVARAGLGTINHSLLTVDSLRSAGVVVAGVVINRYPAENATIAEESNPRAIERWGRVPVLAVVPQVAGGVVDHLPADIVSAIGMVDWSKLAASRASQTPRDRPRRKRRGSGK